MSRLSRGYTIFIIALTLYVVVANSLQAEIPKKINYQGKLTDGATGSPLAGSHEMTFGIYDDPGTGSLLWSESQTLSADSAGIFSVILGSDTPIAISFDGPVWLEVGVGGEVLSPRREIVSVPFAFRAEEADHSLNADSLGGYAADDFVREGETSVITSEMIADGTGSGLDADMVDGLNADAFADTGHLHDDRYYTQDSLSTPGTVNDGSNPVDWTKLKGIPGGFADGVDDVGGAGDGHSLDAADGDPLDVVFVSNAGNVGVGTLSPGEKLDVDGSVNLGGYLKMDEVTVLSTDGIYNVHLGRGAGPQSTGEYNTFLGCRAGSTNMEGHQNTFVGFDSGRSNTSGCLNTFVGHSAGHTNTTGGACTFVGYLAGHDNSTSHFNTFVGYYAGSSNTTGQHNTFLGAATGDSNIDGLDNSFIGGTAGFNNVSGSGNTYLGASSGLSNTAGDNNVFIGYKAGYNEMGSNKLYIANSDVGPPLIYGDFAAGRVGIGTTSPSEALEVNGAAKITAAGSPLKLRTEAGYIELESDNPDPIGLRLSNASRDWYLINGTGFGDRLSFYDSDAGKERLVIDGPTGRVGIGVSSPSAALTINDNITGIWPSGANIVVGDSDGYPSIIFGKDVDNFCELGWMQPNAHLISAGGMVFRLNSNDTDDVMFTAAGDIGVGTDHPEEKLHIVGENPRILIESTTSNPEINFKSTGDATTEIWSLYKNESNDDLHFYQNGDNRLTIKNSTGNVGIGTHDTGSYKLYVQGGAYATGGWTASDLRFKDEIGGIENALDKVLGLRGVLFKWKTEEYADRGFPEGKHYGVIAQDVEKVLPEIVRTGPDGGKAIAYSEIIPVLIESIRELKAENGALKQRIEALEVARN